MCITNVFTTSSFFQQSDDSMIARILPMHWVSGQENIVVIVPSKRTITIHKKSGLFYYQDFLFFFYTMKGYSKRVV